MALQATTPWPLLAPLLGVTFLLELWQLGLSPHRLEPLLVAVVHLEPPSALVAVRHAEGPSPPPDGVLAYPEMVLDGPAGFPPDRFGEAGIDDRAAGREA